jgi:hypothetical protein
MHEIPSEDELKKRAGTEIPECLEKALLKLPVRERPLDDLVRMAHGQIVLDLERGSLDLEAWRGLGFSPETALSLVSDTLDGFLAKRRTYPLDFAVRYERLRSSAQKEAKPGCEPYEGRPHVDFGLVVHGLQLIDPNNLIFELQGEASVGIPLTHATGYLEEPTTKREDLFEALGAKNSCDGILHFHDSNKEKRVRSLLQIRMRGGRLEESYSYFRYGIASDRVWLIQEFNAYLYLPADFQNLPFDEFPVVADFNVGLGGDVVNVKLNVEKVSPEILFSEEFDAGEFQADKKSASLTGIGYLHDPSHFVDNVVRLKFGVKRNPRNMMLRIGFPLLLMAGLLLAGGWYGVDQMESQVIPAVLVAMVALQLASAQGMPRDARFSRLDRCFVASYILAVLLFPLAHASSLWPAPWPIWAGFLRSFIGPGSTGERRARAGLVSPKRFRPSWAVPPNKYQAFRRRVSL